MTAARLTLTCLAFALVAAAPSSPALRLFAGDGFAAGQWRMTPLDAEPGARISGGRARCLLDPQALVHAGHASGGAGCAHTVVEDLPDRAVVTYVCPGQGYGRTELRRADRGLFVVSAQGISGREPFDMRGEFRRVGDCERSAR